MTSIPVLTYHSIDPSGSVISVSAEAFRNHIRILRESEFEVISLADAIRLLKTKLTVDKKVVLTFDDGFENFYTVAVPLLAENRMPATVFLVSGYCGRKNDWPAQSNEVPRLPMLTWSMAAELQRSGIDIGAHSCTHPDLTRLAPDQAKAEIIHSRDEIRQKTGSAVVHFAYPYGRSNSFLRKIVAANFEAGCGTYLSETKDADDLSNLSRVDVYYISRYFEILGRSWLTPYLSLRNLLHGLREKF